MGENEPKRFHKNRPQGGAGRVYKNKDFFLAKKGVFFVKKRTFYMYLFFDQKRTKRYRSSPEDAQCSPGILGSDWRAQKDIRLREHFI
jgi:hypothetical protein